MYLLTQLFRMWENAYFQYCQNTLEPGLWQVWKGVILSYYHQPGIQDWWQLRAHANSNEFWEFLETSAAPEDRIRLTREIVLPAD